MKLLTLIAISVITVSCGKGGGGSAPAEEASTVPAPVTEVEIPGKVVIDQPPTQGSEAITPVVAQTTTPPAAPVVIPPAPVLPVYIIGGDANATRLMYSLTGTVLNASVGKSDLMHPQHLANIYGYASPTVSMAYWNAPGMADPLLSIVSQRCAVNTYFVWYQGDAEPWRDGNMQPVYPVYNSNMDSFLSKVRIACANIKVIVVPITSNSNNGPYLSQVINNQHNVQGVTYFSTSSYNPFVNIPSPQGYWVNEQGYTMLWNDLTSHNH